MDKLLKISANRDYCECDGCCGCEIEPKVEEVYLTQLMNEMSDWELQSHGFCRVKVDPKTKTLPQTTVNTLKQHGWVHASSAKTRAEKKVLEEEYWYLESNATPYGSRFIRLDMDNVQDHILDQLADGAKIVQVVSVKSVLPDAQYQRYLKAKEKKEVAAKAKKEKNKEKLAAKKQAEIDKAKRLLKEVGELK